MGPDSRDRPSNLTLGHWPPLQSPMASPPPSLLSRVVGHDAAVSLRLHTAFLPVPRFLLKALEVSGDGRLWFPLLLAVLPLFPSSPIPLGLLLGSLLDLLLVGLIKHLVRRPRPLYNKGMSLVFAVDHWSFPSGHSSRVLFIACFIFLSSAYGDLLAVYWDLRSSWIWGWCRGEPAELLMLLVFLWSAATSFSRVLLGRHFVLDVVAGAWLGFLEALFVFHFLNFGKLHEYLIGKLSLVL